VKEMELLVKLATSSLCVGQADERTLNGSYIFAVVFSSGADFVWDYFPWIFSDAQKTHL